MQVWRPLPQCCGCDGRQQQQPGAAAATGAGSGRLRVQARDAQIAVQMPQLPRTGELPLFLAMSHARCPAFSVLQFLSLHHPAADRCCMSLSLLARVQMQLALQLGTNAVLTPAVLQSVPFALITAADTNYTAYLQPCLLTKPVPPPVLHKGCVQAGQEHAAGKGRECAVLPCCSAAYTAILVVSGSMIIILALLWTQVCSCPAMCCTHAFHTHTQRARLRPVMFMLDSTCCGLVPR